MHDEAAVNQRIDNRSVRHFDRYRNGMCRPGGRQQPITQLLQTRTVMRELPFRDDASLNLLAVTTGEPSNAKSEVYVAYTSYRTIPAAVSFTNVEALKAIEPQIARVRCLET
jgi:hypothetical protein